MNKNASVGIPMKKICGRLTRILCTCAVFVSLTGAAYAQSAPVTLDRKKAPVREILNEIERQTDYLFVYSSEQVDFSVSVTAHDEPVQTVLRRIFEGTPIRFTLEGKHIVLRRQPQTAANAAAASPAKQTVTGTVTDTAGKPVVGATVLVKGGTVGTTTDVNGRFSLTIPAGSPLEVSFLGYARQEIATAGRTSLDIRLEEDAATLDEVVVVGYGTMKRRNLVGAVDQVDSRVIGDRSNGNLARSLQGELPGLNISFSDSKPSRSASFNVRGETSIGAGGNALVLIDGVEGSMDAINPQDVESVSVLKDASSTAVYGARGAFGVVLVTTKSPKRGAPEINYNGSVTFNRRTVIPDVITDGLTWVNWWKDSYNGYYNGSKSLLSHIDSTVPYSEAIYQELIRRQAAGVAGDNRLVGDQRFQLGVQGVLQRQPLGDRFNQQRGIGQGIQRRGGGQTGQYRIAVGGILLTAGLQLAQDGAGHCRNLGETLRVGVIQADGVTVTGEMAGDTDAHQSRAEYRQAWCKHSGSC